MTSLRFTYYRYLFGISTIWNGTLAIIFILWQKYLFHYMDMPTPEPFLWYMLFLGSVALFGAGYALIAMNPNKNQGIAFIGILGKIGIFLIYGRAYILHEIHGLLLCIAACDILFAILFTEYLFYCHKLESAEY